MHIATLRAVGGSISVTLPRQMLRALGLVAGAAVTVTLEDGRLVLSPARPRYSLSELLKGMRKGDMPKAAGWDDMPPVGREAPEAEAQAPGRAVGCRPRQHAA